MRKTDMNQKNHINDQELAAIRMSVRATYISTGRDQLLVSYLRELVKNVADWENSGFGSKRRALFLIGDSGSGKTRSLQYHFATMPEFQPYQNEYGETVSPVLSIDAPRPCSTMGLAVSVLRKMGLPTKGRRYEDELYETLKTQLRERGVKYLHIDEMQHVIRHNTALTIRHVQDTLKSLIQGTDWPLHTIYSGVAELAKLHTGDRQMANRSSVCRYGALSCPADAHWIANILNNVAVEGCGLELAPELIEEDFIERLCLAGSGSFGSIIAMVQESCFHALEKKRTTVTMKEFARNYGRDTGCLPRDNVFTADRWRDLVPGHALADLV